MARELGGWLEDPALFAEMLRGVAFYDEEDIRAYLGSPDNPGPLDDTMRNAIEVWSELDVLKVEVSPADVIVHGILDD